MKGFVTIPVFTYVTGIGLL